MEYSNTLQDNLLHGTDEHKLERITHHASNTTQLLAIQTIIEIAIDQMK